MVRREQNTRMFRCSVDWPSFTRGEHDEMRRREGNSSRDIRGDCDKIQVSTLPMHARVKIGRNLRKGTEDRLSNVKLAGFVNLCSRKTRSLFGNVDAPAQKRCSGVLDL